MIAPPVTTKMLAPGFGYLKASFAGKVQGDVIKMTAEADGQHDQVDREEGTSP